jgi:hypothetical protein
MPISQRSPIGLSPYFANALGRTANGYSNPYSSIGSRTIKKIIRKGKKKRSINVKKEFTEYHTPGSRESQFGRFRLS